MYPLPHAARVLAALAIALGVAWSSTPAHVAIASPLAQPGHEARSAFLEEVLRELGDPWSPDDPRALPPEAPYDEHDSIEMARFAHTSAGTPWPPAAERVALGEALRVHFVSESFWQEDLEGPLAGEIEPVGIWVLPVLFDGEPFAVVEADEPRGGPSEPVEKWSVFVRRERDVAAEVTELGPGERLLYEPSKDAYLAVAGETVRPLDDYAATFVERPMSLAALQDRWHAEYLDDVQTNLAMAAEEAQSTPLPERRGESRAALGHEARALLTLAAVLGLALAIAPPIGLAARARYAALGERPDRRR